MSEAVNNLEVIAYDLNGVAGILSSLASLSKDFALSDDVLRLLSKVVQESVDAILTAHEEIQRGHLIEP